MSRSLFLSVMIISSLGFAAPSPSTGGRSAKKIAADQNRLRAPQVLEENDALFGVRATQGSSFEGAATLGASYEYMVHPNFGLNGQFHHAAYSTKYNVGFASGEWKYTAWTLVAAGTLHGDLFRVKNLDTYATVGLGHSIFNSSWKSNFNLSNPGNAETNKTFLVATLNARYFVDSRWGFSGSLGTGLGVLGIGLDYLF